MALMIILNDNVCVLFLSYKTRTLRNTCIYVHINIKKIYINIYVYICINAHRRNTFTGYRVIVVLFAYRKRNTENSRAHFLNRYVPRAERTSHNTVLMGPYDGVGGRRFIQEIRIIEFMMINGFPFRERESAYVSVRSWLRVFERRARCRVQVHSSCTNG